MASQSKKPLAAAVGTAFLASVALAPLASAAENPFQLDRLAGGYSLAEKGEAEGRCGEGKCGEGKCGEGMAKSEAEGTCGEAKAKSDTEGTCGEGKSEAEGTCGGSN